MNYDKLYLLTKEKLFTDLALTLVDRDNRIIVNVNKNILYASCMYFEKLLTNFKEKNSNDIIIEVPNVYVMYDIIMSFYEQKTNSGNLSENKHLLESIKCYNFIGLDFDKSLLNNLEVSEEDFELFLSVIDLIGYDDKTIHLINKNVPKNYDLSKLSKELLNEMLILKQSYYIVSGSSGGYIKIWSITGKRICKLMNYSDPVLCVDCSPDNKYIASGCEDGRIKIWDIEKGTFINKLMFHEFSIKNICYSPNGRQIISCADRFYIKIWNAETYDLIRTLNNAPQCISKICYSPNGIHIIAASDNYINIWDVTTGILITNVYAVVNIKSICCSCDNKYIISGHVDGIIKIWGTDKLFPISTIKEHLAMITDLCCSSDNKYFVSTSNDNIINLWDIETHKPIKTFLSNNPQHICFSPDNKCIISSNKKGNIDVWDIETGIVINNFNAESVSNIRCIDNRDDILEQRIIASLKEN